jgi:hypothetical protein
MFFGENRISLYKADQLYKSKFQLIKARSILHWFHLCLLDELFEEDFVLRSNLLKS